MKAIITAPLPPPMGGIAKWALDLNGTTIKNNWSFEVLKTNDENTEVYQQIDKHHYFKEIKRSFSIWRKLKKRLKNPSVKVVHCNIPTNFLSMAREFVSALLTKGYKKKFIVHFHCTVPKKVYNKRIMWMMKMLCNVSKNVFVLNRQSYDFVKNNTKANVYLIPNFVSSEMIMTKRTINKNLKTFLYVGGIVEIKGCNLIIETAKHFPEYEFRLIGYVSSEFQNKKLPENVILTGVKTGADLDIEYKRADCFLFLSYMDSEGFSIALTEAMAYGLPCIASDWAANKDMLGSAGGIVVPIKDVEETILAVKKIATDYEFRKMASINNIKKVQENYTKEKVVKIITNTYNEIIEKREKE